MKKKLQNIYLPYYNLLAGQDSWRAHYQILLIIFLKELLELNVNADTMIKNMKDAEFYKKLMIQ